MKWVKMGGWVGLEVKNASGFEVRESWGWNQWALRPQASLRVRGASVQWGGIRLSGRGAGSIAGDGAGCGGWVGALTLVAATLLLGKEVSSAFSEATENPISLA